MLLYLGSEVPVRPVVDLTLPELARLPWRPCFTPTAGLQAQACLRTVQLCSPELLRHVLSSEKEHKHAALCLLERIIHQAQVHILKI